MIVLCKKYISSKIYENKLDMELSLKLRHIFIVYSITAMPGN